MAVLLLAREVFVGAAIIALVGIAMAFIKFLRSHEDKKIIRQRQIGGSNREERRKEKAISRRKRN